MFNLFKKAVQFAPKVYKSSNELYNLIQGFAIVMLENDVKMLKENKSDESVRAIKFNEADGNGYLLEREILCSVALYPFIEELKISSKEYQSLGSAIFEKYSHKSTVINYLGNSMSLSEFISQRHKMYWNEVEMLVSLENPHPGRILYYLYKPLSVYQAPVPNLNPKLEKGVFTSLQLVTYFNSSTHPLLFLKLPEYLKSTFRVANS